MSGRVTKRSSKEGDEDDENAYVRQFAGKCAEAFRFYEKHLGGKIGTMMTHGQAPDQRKVNPEWKDAVLHARISLGGTESWAQISLVPNPCAAPSAACLTPIETSTYSNRLM
jgi:PhnB protein